MIIINVTMKSSQEKLTANIEKLGSSSSSLSSSSASSSVCDELTSDDNFDTNHHSSALTSCTTNTTTITTTGNGNCINGSINGKVPRIRSVNYANNDHANNALSTMDFMRKNDRLCDVSLEVKGSHLKAHKVVLCATSAYFDAMFNTDEMVERTKSVITLHDIDFDALKLLVDYAYTGQIVISEDNVQLLLPAASLLQINTVREACCKFLLCQLEPSNCLGIRHFADAYSCEELYTTSDKFVVENFPAVAQTEEFLALSYKELEDLISSNHLNVHDEFEVYKAVIRWVRFDLKQRESELAQLLNHVRFPLIHRKTLMNEICKEPLLESNPESKDLLLEAMQYHLCPEQRIGMNSIRTKSRRPKGLRNLLFAIGGCALFAVHNECEYYDPVSDHWIPLASTLTRRSRLGVTSLDRFIFAVGGYNADNKESKELSSAEYYDSNANEWWSLSQDMGIKRSCLACATHNGLIYAAGGYDGASCLNSVERFDPLADTWCSVSAMNGRRRHGRLAVLDSCLYFIGGFDGCNYQSSMERFDPREGKWHVMPGMANRRSSCGVATLNGKIYAVGGNDGTLCLSSVERFDQKANIWENVATLNTKRSTHDLVEADGYLYAIGGNDSVTGLNSVERYDSVVNKWSYISPMIIRRSSLGAAVLECPGISRVHCKSNNDSRSD
ncbi:kelch-like protein 28 isoform X3 [Brevipalpus obovatus]|uniref:kelch-like protein 28 isoform X3 n=1 Tax=Brevipalpus obovatus TaxID=246614 RepID=UPI003D9E445C